jgi:hypothetical protein
LSIPKFDERFDVKKCRAAVAYTELILSIVVKSSECKLAFNLVKGCKTKAYPDGNAATTWERLKNKYEPVSHPSWLR